MEGGAKLADSMLPWSFQIGLISAMATKGPVKPTVTNIDLIGSGGSTTICSRLVHDGLPSSLVESSSERDWL